MKTEFQLAHNREIGRRLNDKVFQQKKAESQKQSFRELTLKRFEVSEGARGASRILNYTANRLTGKPTENEPS